MPGPEYNPSCVSSAATRQAQCGHKFESGQQLPPCTYRQVGGSVCRAELIVGKTGSIEPLKGGRIGCLMLEDFIDGIL